MDAILTACSLQEFP